MKTASISIIEETGYYLLIKDLGPWDRYLTITNDAEKVVERLVEKDLIRGRRLFYIDSEGSLDEIVIENDKFKDFAAGNDFRDLRRLSGLD